MIGDLKTWWVSSCNNVTGWTLYICLLNIEEENTIYTLCNSGKLRQVHEPLGLKLTTLIQMKDSPLENPRNPGDTHASSSAVDEGARALLE